MILQVWTHPPQAALAHPLPGLWPLWEAAPTKWPPRAPWLFPLPGPHLASFLSVLLAGTGPRSPTPRNLGISTLDKARDRAGDRATSRGAEVTGPEASHELLAGNSHFLLLVLHFLAVAPRLLSSTSTHPHPAGPPHLTRQRLPALPKAYSCPWLSDSSLGLSAWAGLSYFGLIKVSRLLGHDPSVLGPQPLGSPAPLPVSAPCLAVPPR